MRVKSTHVNSGPLKILAVNNNSSFIIIIVVIIIIISYNLLLLLSFPRLNGEPQQFFVEVSFIYHRSCLKTSV